MNAAYEVRQEVLNEAYRPHQKQIQKKSRVSQPEPVVVTVEEIIARSDCPKSLAESMGVKPDMTDKVYVYLRSYVPGWALIGFILLGFITFILATPAKKTIKNIIRSWVKEADK